MNLKRITLFILVNVLIVATISIVTHFLGLSHYLTKNGINFEMLIGFCLLWGFGGAFFSLLISKKIAYWLMGVQKKDSKLVQSYHAKYSWIESRLIEYSRKAGLEVVPDLGIYQSDDINAFATGPSKSNSLVAFSTGLLNNMSDDEIEGVLAHEVAHISNGDMVTMTLVQGVVNSFVMFIARIISWFISQSVEEERRPMVQFISTIVLEILFGILGIITIAYFSRIREFKADFDGAKIAGHSKMINALKALKSKIENVSDNQENTKDFEPALASLKINNKKNFFKLFSTHPPLDERIKQLNIQFNQVI